MFFESIMMIAKWCHRIHFLFRLKIFVPTKNLYYYISLRFLNIFKGTQLTNPLILILLQIDFFYIYGVFFCFILWLWLGLCNCRICYDYLISTADVFVVLWFNIKSSGSFFISCHHFQAGIIPIIRIIILLNVLNYLLCPIRFTGHLVQKLIMGKLYFHICCSNSQFGFWLAIRFVALWLAGSWIRH